jgi:hypothetical protein
MNYFQRGIILSTENSFGTVPKWLSLSRKKKKWNYTHLFISLSSGYCFNVLDFSIFVCFLNSILSGGLKIMPHAGGRVGRGLYFADMIAKSSQYLGLHGNIVCFFSFSFLLFFIVE